MDRKNIVQGGLSRISQISMRYPVVTLLFFIMIVALFIYPATQLEVNTSIESMFGDDDDSIRKWMDINDNFGEQELVTIVVDCSESNETTAIDYIHEILPCLMESGNFREIEYSVDSRLIEDGSFLYLPLALYDDLRFDNLTLEELDLWYSNMNQVLDQERYLSSEDSTIFLVNMNLNRSINDIEVRNEIFDGLYDIIDDVNAMNSEYDDLEVGFTGGMMVMDYESDQMALGDLYITTLITFIFILIVLFLTFRSISLPLLSIIPLIMGIIITAGIIQLWLGELGFFTSTFAVLLFGIGIAFCIHILSRFMDEYRISGDIEYSMERTYRFTGMGVILGGLTTSTVFFALYFGKTEAVHEMGFVAALGLMITMVCVLFVIPALVRLRMRYGKLGEKLQKDKKREFNILSPAGSIIKRFFLVFILIMLVTVAFMVIKLPDAEISGDITEIQPTDIPSYRQLEKIKDHFNYTENYVLLTCGSYQELENDIGIFSKNEEILGIESIYDYIPTDQSEKLAILYGIRDEIGTEHTPDWLEVDEITWKDIPSSIRKNWVYQNGDEIQFLIRLTMKGDIFREDYNDRIMKDIEMTNHNVTSQAMVFNALIDLMTDDVINVSIYATIPVMMIVFIGFRRINPLYTILAFIPVAFGLMGILAFYEFFNVDLNVISILMAPLVIGIGIDNGIHLINRYMEEGKGSVPLVIKQTGKAISLTSITTILAFSSFTMADHPGMRSLGRVPVLGLALCLVASIFFLPPVLVLIFERTRGEEID